MHESSYLRMQEFVNKYLDKNKSLKILDIGGKLINRIYKDFFINKPNWDYKSCDIDKGQNVDIVIKDGYNWVEIKSRAYDVVISGQCMEHVADLQRWGKEIKRVLKPKGLICMIAPWSWNYHPAPIDCWRIMPDGMRWFLNDVIGCSIISVKLKEKDCIGIGRKN